MDVSNTSHKKWDNIVIGLTGYKKWSHIFNIVGIILTDVSEIIDIDDTFFKDLYTISKNVPVIYISQDILGFKTQEYWQENYDNLINLDDIDTNYPYIQLAWDKSDEDALAIISMIMRYNQISLVNTTISSGRIKILHEYGIKVIQGGVPNECWLFLQYFKHNVNKRHREIRECLRKNCENPLIDRIVLINEKDYSAEWERIPNAGKIKQIILGNRLTYADFLRTVSEIAPDDCYVILANADIYFGDSLKYLWSINIKDKMLALLRWDVFNIGEEENAKLFGPRTDSQDCWIFDSLSIKHRDWDYSIFNYQLGKPGCDNRFTSDILRMKFLITNPALSIKSYHLHNSDVRDYSKSEYIPSDIYLFIEPTRILDMKQLSVPAQYSTYLNNESIEFEVKSSSVSSGISYCTMLEKNDRYKWEPSVENYYFDKIPIYNWKNACVSTNGLVYDLWNIYTGKYTKTHNYWEKCTTDIFTPLEYRKKALAIPFRDNSVFEKGDIYCLEYLSRVARLLKEYPESSFWIPQEFVIYVRQFAWKSDKLNALQYNPDMACYADEVIGFLPGPHELGKEDIDALRELYPSWNRDPIKELCLVICDDILDDTFVKQLEKQLGDNWSVNITDCFDKGKFYDVTGAQLCIFIGGKDTQEKWSRLWALPENSCVIEFQKDNQKEIDGEFQHLAHVSSLKSWVYLLTHKKKQDIKQEVLEGITKWFNKNSDELA
jgi:hypothetical protein